MIGEPGFDPYTTGSPDSHRKCLYTERCTENVQILDLFSSSHLLNLLSLSLLAAHSVRAWYYSPVRHCTFHSPLKRMLILRTDCRRIGALSSASAVRQCTHTRFGSRTHHRPLTHLFALCAKGACVEQNKSSNESPANLVRISDCSPVRDAELFLH